jgi:hypothetical protein
VVSGAAWQIFEGDDLIGEVHNCGFWDMFWTCGDFQPYGRFEQDYRSVFDDFVDGRAGGDQARRTRALQTVRQRLHLVDPHGQRWAIFSLVIEGDHARFRLVHGQRPRSDHDRGLTR